MVELSVKRHLMPFNREYSWVCIVYNIRVRELRLLSNGEFSISHSPGGPSTILDAAPEFAELPSSAIANVTLSGKYYCLTSRFLLSRGRAEIRKNNKRCLLATVFMLSSVLLSKYRVSLPRTRINGLHRALSSIILGKATPQATQEFVSKRGLPLYHRFEKTGLFCNPIVHGQVNGFDGDCDPKLLASIAIAENASNCIYVYSHDSSRAKTSVATNEFVLTDIGQLLKDVEVPRESLILVADLGFVDSEHEVSKRIERAFKVTNLQTIDCFIIRVSNGHDKISITLSIIGRRAVFLRLREIGTLH